MSAPRKITAWGTGRKLSLLGGSPDFQHLYHHDDVVRELLTALAQAAVPLEGLTLAAHATGSNMGLCKGTWDEINNGVAHIRAALAKIAQEG